MRVLLVNSFHYLRGGDCSYTFALADLLRSRGHEVCFFGMKHPRNAPCEQERYFVEPVDFAEANRNKSVANGLRVVTRSIHSVQARRNIGRLLDDLRPDVAHLQNIHAHITPSILYELERRAIPVVWTLHDYKLICPNTHLLSHGVVCESCKGGRFLACTKKRCKKGSLAASLVASVEAIVHRWQKIGERVDAFISPSRFLIDKFVEFGWARSRLHHLPYCLPDDLLQRTESDDRGYALYFGQLERWKGLRTLVDAWVSMKDCELRIVGEGSERELLEEQVRTSGVTNVRFEGYRSGRALAEILRGSSFVCVPSEWYENFPYVVMESMAMSKPVIASRMGGLPELVQDGETGFLIDPGQSQQLVEKARLLSGDPDRRRRMGERGRAVAVAEFNSDVHHAGLLEIYDAAFRTASARLARPASRRAAAF